MARIYPRIPAEVRFFAKVRKTETCWLWGGGKLQRGYGAFKETPTKQVRAHRWSYEYHVGPIPEGLLLRHTCDVPSCVNPDHLVPGTAKENQQDMLERQRLGRRSTTSRVNGRKGSRLTPELAAEIREKYAAGNYSYRSLAREYGIGHTPVRHIVIGMSWRN